MKYAYQNPKSNSEDFIVWENNYTVECTKEPKSPDSRLGFE